MRVLTFHAMTVSSDWLGTAFPLLICYNRDSNSIDTALMLYLLVKPKNNLIEAFLICCTLNLKLRISYFR